MLNLRGKRFGRLIALYDTNKRKNGNVVWMCLCDCGNHKEIISDSLRRGHTKSCGCLQKEKAKNLVIRRNWKHGGKNSRIYKIWKSMKCRCYVKSCTVYKYYGKRGITIDQEWKDNFMAFRDWALTNGYRDNLTIDRINNNGNYTPKNCQWITLRENILKERINTP